jgi:hypothetical protein
LLRKQLSYIPKEQEGLAPWLSVKKNIYDFTFWEDFLWYLILYLDKNPGRWC